mmetsp:Transcript_16352/g.20370  ORF Transcript_16352/g.20370 Transcript_16352/m.20370 type:complete len:414 (-) Transcript_16352:243-1484(-)|eukprot:CAMPEP_0172488896 /NCGR_PEP_ID=MMETSP1066-20121228/18610_1 /TAXON_ID=671091 /ORGANISM="Coscinodiscus wailesii, Strain CCMP2513" /LENGTH=413 /DNA_ID=CAMNT_0013256395 /DNA_START=112 /DNA_END=1353 /DNA_ORIENTATION=-
MKSLLDEVRRSKADKNMLRHVPEESKRYRTAPVNKSLTTDDNAAEDERKTWVYWHNSGCSTWYEDIKDLTFTSTFCEITPNEAKIIVSHWDDHERIDSSPNISEDPLKTPRTQLKHLQERLHTAIAKEIEKSPTKQVFVKLSTRSPKDSKKALARAAEAYETRLRALHHGNNCDACHSENDKWIFLCEEVTQSLAVDNASDAIDLLLDSERVYEDLKYALNDSVSSPDCFKSHDKTQIDKRKEVPYSQQKEQMWNMTIVARAWDPRLTASSEFRGICWNGKLTCLCQYFHPLFFSELVSKKDVIENDIHAMVRREDVQRAIDRLGGHCIIDFAWLAPGVALIVEMNAFDGGWLGTLPASTGLFLWDDPSDQLVMRGESPFEFRIRERPLDKHEFKKNCHPKWRDIIYGKRHTL